MSLWKKWVLCCDNHGDSQDTNAVEAFLNFVDQYNPDIRLHAGDNWDFRPLRRKATADEKRESLIADYEAGKEFITRYRPTKKARGNHDERLWDLAQNGVGVERDFATQGINEIAELLDSMNCPMVPWDKRRGLIQIGQLGVIHGYAHGMNAIKQNIRSYGSRVKGIIQGHTHTAEHYSEANIDDREGWVCPCLCQLDLDYNRGTLGTLKQRNGWMYGVTHELTGDYLAWVAIGIDGKYLLPTGLEEF